VSATVDKDAAWDAFDELLRSDERRGPEIVDKLAHVLDCVGRPADAARVREARYDSDRVRAILDEIADEVEP
jgi:hypothetical protein